MGLRYSRLQTAPTTEKLLNWCNLQPPDPDKPIVAKQKSRFSGEPKKRNDHESTPVKLIGLTGQAKEPRLNRKKGLTGQTKARKKGQDRVLFLVGPSYVPVFLSINES